MKSDQTNSTYEGKLLCLALQRIDQAEQKGAEDHEIQQYPYDCSENRNQSDQASNNITDDGQNQNQQTLIRMKFGKF